MSWRMSERTCSSVVLTRGEHLLEGLFRRKLSLDFLHPRVDFSVGSSHLPRPALLHEQPVRDHLVEHAAEDLIALPSRHRSAVASLEGRDRTIEFRLADVLAVDARDHVRDLARELAWPAAHRAWLRQVAASLLGGCGRVRRRSRCRRRPRAGAENDEGEQCESSCQERVLFENISWAHGLGLVGLSDALGPGAVGRAPQLTMRMVQCGALPTDATWPSGARVAKARGQKPEYNRTKRLSAGRVLAVAAQLGLVSRLSAVIAAVLSVRSLGFDHALTRRVRTLGRSSHDDLRFALYAPARARARSSVSMAVVCRAPLGRGAPAARASTAWAGTRHLR